MGALPEPWASLRARIESIESRLTHLLNRSPFFGTGMHPNGVGGIDSDNFVAGTSGYSFKNNGNAEFNNLTLRGGIIGNDALANPIQVSSVVGGATNFSISTTSTLKSSYSLTVPAGFTQAVVLCFASGNAINSTGATDYLTVQAAVNGATGGGVNSTVASGAYGTTITGVRTSTLSGLTGGATVTAEAWAGTQTAAWAASASNFVMINAFAVWLR